MQSEKYEEPNIMRGKKSSGNLSNDERKNLLCSSMVFKNPDSQNLIKTEKSPRKNFYKAFTFDAKEATQTNITSLTNLDIKIDEIKSKEFDIECVGNSVNKNSSNPPLEIKDSDETNLHYSVEKSS